jgi:hypothetical protein
MTNPEVNEDRFYEDFDAAIRNVLGPNKLIIVGDFIAKVGLDHMTWESIIGKNGVGECNGNGLLMHARSTHDLTNTLFKLPKRRKTSWMHPRSRQWHLVDYVITRRTEGQDGRVTKAMTGVECWTDHCVIISKLNLTMKPQGSAPSKKLNTAKLKTEKIANELTSAISATLTDLD